ncbi:hypothetical protein OLL83_000404 [Shewanella algae]|uniref:hypothetical protein n=1 Tax=Shewanella algae TaxID=38313 RepID=UPI001183BDD1|nr:hypothetical protein [Shewanella algae]UZD58920.1 hypothetical protein OLL83_000404 [Shewanella algae]
MWNLIKGTGRLVVNSINLMETGVNALNEAAEELRRSTEIWAAEESVKFQLKQINRMESAPASELSKAYEVLIERLEEVRTLKPHDSFVAQQLTDARTHRQQQELKRHTTTEQQYPQEGLKNRFNRRDEMLHGLCEAWYPNGIKNWEARFVEGKVLTCKAWRDDGQRWFKYDVEDEASEVISTFWAAGEQVILKLKRNSNKKGVITSEIYLEGVCLGAIKTLNGKICTHYALFVTRALIAFLCNPRLWYGWDKKNALIQNFKLDMDAGCNLFEEIKALN